jgi:hypothetical protein
MLRNRTVVVWSLAMASAIAFLAGAAAPGAVGFLGDTLAPTVAAQDPPPTQEPPDPGGRGAGRGGQGQAPRPYAQVITSSAKTDEGIFKVHRVTTAAADNLFYEIPKAELGKDFLWKTQLKKTTIGTGFGGQDVSSHVVRWVAKGDRILLLEIDYSIIADPSLPIRIAVDDANYPAIIRTFPVAAYAPNGDPVIDVTQIFTTDVPEFSARGAVGGRGVANDRTFLERAVSFPENINVEVMMTYTGGAAEGGGGGGGGRGAGGARGMRGPSGTVVVAHSMVKLPDRPMMPRAFDERIGFITQDLVDYGTEEHRSVAKRFIKRYRLEKKDAGAGVSDPVKPIVFYVDAGTPKALVPYVKRGIEEWQSALEAAGFRNAIVARDAPTNDAEWSAEDARYSVVRWAPPADASTSLIHDPRSGEVLSSNIDVFPNVPTFGEDWYFVQTAPLDKRVQQYPIPIEVRGELVRYFVAHQVGHALGLQHNRKAGSAYTIAQVRDPKWVSTMGFTPSIMDDSRFNYVAQPEDGLAPGDLIPKVGAYDKWAVRWGYSPVPGAKSSDSEKATLDKWAREQDEKPYLRFSTEGQNNTDPGENPTPGAAQNADQNEGGVGNADAVQATTLGLRNLERVSKMLMTATTTKPGDPWDDLERVYGRMVNQWSVEMGQVVRVVGGIESQQQHIGQDGMRFKTVPRARQEAALKFLLGNAFTVPSFMIQPDVLRRIQPTGVVDRVRAAQTALMGSLLQGARIDRMTEQATLDGAVAYPPLSFLADVRNGVWSELAKPGAAINLYRRNVQRAYLDTLDQRLNGTPGSSAEVRALVKGELKALDKQLQTAAAAAGLDENTRRHLNDSQDFIEMILDPRVPRPAPDPAAAGLGGRGRGGIR